MAFGKWIGGVLGWSLGGPIGGLVGFALGSVLDKSEVRTSTGSYSGRNRPRTGQGDFNMSMVVLSAAVMKADGKTMKSELDYVRRFFEQQFGKSKANDYVKVLRDVLKQEIPLREVCEQIARFMPLAMRMQLLHYLYGIAQADGHVHSKEVELITRISDMLRIPRADHDSIKAMFYKEVGGSYKILEIEPSVSDDEVKKAYRRMAKRHHPDKVAQLGEEIQKGAKEKFQRIQEAYEQIKKERSMS